MTRFLIAAAATFVATVSLASAAEAGWKWKHGHYNNNHGWNNHMGFIVNSHGHNNDYCFVKKTKQYDDWGNVYISKVRVCD